jgi:hypothetical protein
MTLVPEVGHWLSLSHKFHGGCEGTGDGVTDTPAEALNNEYSEICDVQRDSCPGGGKDSVRNYMNYSPE